MRSKALAALLTGVCLCLGVAAAALAQGTDPTPTVFDVTPTTAQVTALVQPPGDVGSYHLEWGTDDAYSTSSDPIAIGVDTGPTTVGGTLTGLLPATTYFVRVVVTGAGDPVVSPGVGFTTSPDPNPPRPPDPDAQGAQLEPAQTVETAPPDPERRPAGRGRRARPRERGRHRQAGGDRRVRDAARPAPRSPWAAWSTRPPARVRLIAQTSDNTTQDVVLRGAKFEIRQAKDGSGITEFVLKGEDFSTCGRAQSAATKKRKPRRSLWASDRGGKFRTRGLNSVATVRGTTWRVTDTCAGTTTTVYSGSVVVREARSGRSYVVRKGQQHLAAARR